MNNCYNRKSNPKSYRESSYQKASLTVEAAFVLPIFLYFMIAFLYYIQIFMVQEKIQAAITKMGLNLSKSAYVFQDFPGTEGLPDFDFSIFGEEYDLGLDEFADRAASDSVLKYYAAKYLDTTLINKSCIKEGYDGINFNGSSIFNGSEYIDIVVNYQVKIPVKIFMIDDMNMIQRVRLRCWSGYKVAAAYQSEEEANTASVFITDTGSVYHKSAECSHIKLSVRSVAGIPTGLSNDYGSRYNPCEACCDGQLNELGTYYITSDGTRYHSIRNCSKIKRSVKEISISEVGERTPCKRCYQ